MERPENCEVQFDAVYHGEAQTTVDNDQARDGTPTRLLVKKNMAEEETIEEMVRRLERELDEEFLHLFPTAAETPVSAEASEQKVPEAVIELVELETEDKKVAYSFVTLEILNVLMD